MTLTLIAQSRDRNASRPRTVRESPVAVQRQAPIDQRLLQRKEGQCACGGSCPRCQRKNSSIQPQLAVSQPGDASEREADQVAEQVMRMPEPQLQRACACGGECPKCRTQQRDQEHIPLQTKRVGSGNLGQTAVPPIVHEVLRSTGEPLDPAARAFMEPRFGQDFSRLRVHTNEAAARSALAVDAKAYTVGEHVVFGERQYSPTSYAGRRLLAHELTHVAQQGVGLARNGPARLPAISVEEQFQFLFDQMGFTSAPHGAPIEDPGGTGAGVGAARAPGYQVHAAVQVIDPEGRQVYLAPGAYMGGGGPHGEEQSIRDLRNHLPTDGSLRGGRMIVTVTQDPCGPDRHNCALQLRNLAKEYGLQAETFVPERDPVGGGGGAVRPPTAARGAQRTDRPPMRYRSVDLESLPAAGGSAPEPAKTKADPAKPVKAKAVPSKPTKNKAGPARPKADTPKPSKADSVNRPAAPTPPSAKSGAGGTRLSGMRGMARTAGVAAGGAGLSAGAEFVMGWYRQKQLKELIDERIVPAIEAEVAKQSDRLLRAQIENAGTTYYWNITIETGTTGDTAGMTGTGNNLPELISVVFSREDKSSTSTEHSFWPPGAAITTTTTTYSVPAGAIPIDEAAAYGRLSDMDLSALRARAVAGREAANMPDAHGYWSDMVALIDANDLELMLRAQTERLPMDDVRNYFALKAERAESSIAAGAYPRAPGAIGQLADQAAKARELQAFVDAPFEDVVDFTKKTGTGFQLAQLRSYAANRSLAAGASGDSGAGQASHAYWSQMVRYIDSL